MKRALITTAVIALLTSLNAYAGGVDDQLLGAVRSNDIAQVHSLLSRGAQVDATDPAGNTALMVAAACGYTEIARTLIESGADLDARGYIGNTALIFATQEGHAEIARLLVENGADVETRNEYGSSARKLAAGWGHRDIAQILTEGQETEWFAADGFARQAATFLIGIVAIIAIPALTVGAVHASVQVPRSHLAK